MIKRLFFVVLLISILTLQVFAAPVIVKQPQDVYLPEGTTSVDRVSFSVIAQGVGDLSYQWQYLSPATGNWGNLGAPSATTPTLALSFADESGFDRNSNGKGLFRCIVSDDEGSTTSVSVTTRSVGFYVSATIQQLLSFVGNIGSSILQTVVDVSDTIIDVPFLALALGFFFVGGICSLIGRFLSRS